MNRRLAVLVVVALVALSGCSALDSGDSGAFDESVEFASAGVAGEPIEIQVRAENTGESTAEYEATLEVDGESATTESRSIDAGERTTVMFTTTIEDPGEYDLTVAGVERTLTVYESPMDLFRAIETPANGTRIAELDTEASGLAEIDGQLYDTTLESTSTERTNYSAKTQYTTENSTVTVAGQTTDETTEEWVVDDTLYEKTVDQNSGEVTFSRQPSDAFEEANVSEVQQFLSTDHGDEEYVFTLSASSAAAATELWSALGEEDDAFTESVQNTTFEFRIDRGTGRVTSAEFDASVKNYDVFSTFDITIHEQYVTFDEPVTVSVPDEVRENATAPADT
jgi:hypothetical protein